jgi:hypothetical protein
MMASRVTIQYTIPARRLQAAASSDSHSFARPHSFDSPYHQKNKKTVCFFYYYYSCFVLCFAETKMRVAYVEQVIVTTTRLRAV